MYVAKQVLDAEHDHPAPAAYPYLNIATKVKFSYYKNYFFEIYLFLSILELIIFLKKSFFLGEEEKNLYFGILMQMLTLQKVLYHLILFKKKGYMFSFSKNK